MLYVVSRRCSLCVVSDVFVLRFLHVWRAANIILWYMFASEKATHDTWSVTSGERCHRSHGFRLRWSCSEVFSLSSSQDAGCVERQLRPTFHPSFTSKTLEIKHLVLFRGKHIYPPLTRKFHGGPRHLESNVDVSSSQHLFFAVVRR